MGFFTCVEDELMQRAQQLGDSFGENAETVRQLATEFNITDNEVEEILQGDHDGGDADYDDSMDGDHESALASAGMGTDEDYGCYGEE